MFSSFDYTTMCPKLFVLYSFWLWKQPCSVFILLSWVINSIIFRRSIQFQPILICWCLRCQNEVDTLNFYRAEFSHFHAFSIPHCVLAAAFTASHCLFLHSNAKQELEVIKALICCDISTIRTSKDPPLFFGSMRHPSYSTATSITLYCLSAVFMVKYRSGFPLFSLPQRIVGSDDEIGFWNEAFILVTEVISHLLPIW